MKILPKGSAKPPRILLYSVEGLGKSSFGASAIAPIFIQTEDGLDEIDAQRFPKSKSFEEVMAAIRYLYENDLPYKTLVIDTIDWLESLIWQSVCERHKKNSIEDFGFAKGYKFAMDEWSRLLSALTAMREEKGYAVILLAHAEIKRFDSPDTEPYDRYRIKLHGEAAAKLTEWCDAVLFANYFVTTEKNDVGFNRKVVRGVGGGDRIMYTEERPAFRAKNRYSLPSELPFIKGEAWNTLVSAIVAGRQNNSLSIITEEK